MRVLVAEDEPKVSRFVKQALEDAGMVVDTTASLNELQAAVASNAYDVAVVDRLLKGGDALTTIPSLRQCRPDMGIIVLSALGEVTERVEGLSIGADDYLGKPFHVSELVARVQALGRRTKSGHGGAQSARITHDDLVIDPTCQRVSRRGEKMDLTGKEFRLLLFLARAPGHIRSKAVILDQVWDMDHHPESNVVEVTVANLRTKIDRGRKPLIHSRRGVGYWFGEP